jgi:SAM-dependent methyltransferase
MQDPIQALYLRHSYPPMSHPQADPAVSSVAARMAGLPTAHPSNARILEIGCGSGHHLIPLAMRWPGSRFTGIDLSENAIREATSRVARCGIGNLKFHAVDLRGFVSDDGPFDFITAHGFFSWVPDDVKAVLFSFCRNYLASNEIPTVSYNVESGWSPRFAGIRKTRAILEAGAGDLISALGILRSVTDAESPEQAIIDDMLSKGASILLFDDFSPVNDPWSPERFVRTAEEQGLRWLGESDPGRGETASSPRENLQAKEVEAGRTFRSSMLCLTSARVTGGSDPDDAIESPISLSGDSGFFESGTQAGN